MNALREAVEKFEATQSRLARFGAADTEPDAEFQLVLRHVLDGDDPAIPAGARAWQLFSDMPGAGRAARELSAAALVVVEAAREHPNQLRRYAADGGLWRVM